MFPSKHLSSFKRPMQYFYLLVLIALVTACDSQEGIQQVSYNDRIDLSVTDQPVKQEEIFKFAMIKGSAEDSKAQQIFINYLSRSSGYSFKLVNATNNSHLVEQLGNDDVQFALLSTVSLVPAITEYGVKPIAKVAPPLHKADVQAFFIVSPNSPLTKLVDIKGQSLALGDKVSLSSALIPLVTLANENISLAELGQLSYTGSNKQCINSVLNNTADICAVSAAFAKPYIESEQVRILAASSYYPTSSVASNLYVDDEAQESVRQALFQLTLAYSRLSLTHSVIPDKFSPIDTLEYTPLSDAFIRLKQNVLGQ